MLFITNTLNIEILDKLSAKIDSIEVSDVIALINDSDPKDVLGIFSNRFICRTINSKLKTNFEFIDGLIIPHSGDVIIVITITTVHLIIIK